MPNFIVDDTALPASKVDTTSKPEGVPANRWFGASDFDALKTALNDTKDVLRNTTGTNGFIDGALEGLIADGDTDNRASIYAAIEKAKTLGADLRLPPGELLIYKDPDAFAGLVLEGLSNMRIYGAGRGGTTLKLVAQAAVAGGPCAAIRVTNCRNLVLEGFFIDGNWGNAVTHVTEPSDLQNLDDLNDGELHVDDVQYFPDSGSAIVVTDDGPVDIEWSGKSDDGLVISSGSGVVRAFDKVLLFHKRQGRALIASGSNGQTLPLSGATVNVATTAKLPASVGAGKARIRSTTGYYQITWTSKNGTQLLGVNSTGGSGTLATGYEIDYVDGAGNHESIDAMQVDPKNHAIFLYGSDGNFPTPNYNISIRDVEIRSVYGDGVWIGAWSYGTLLERVFVDVSARNGVTLSSYTDGVTMRDCSLTNIFTTAFDSEPVDAPTRNVIIDGCLLEHWANPSEYDETNFDVANIALSIQGGVVGRPASWNYASSWSVTRTEVRGATLITNAKNVTIDDCDFICDFNGQSYAPITVAMDCDNINVLNSYLYGRTGGTSLWNYGVVNIVGYTSGVHQSVQPGNVTVSGCDIKARNGMHGGYVEGAGGYSGLEVSIVSYTPPAAPSSQGELVCAGTPFAAISGRYTFHQILVDGVLANIVGDDGSDTLYIAPLYEDYASGQAFADRNGRTAPDPDFTSPVAATILPKGGTVLFSGNRIDCVNDDDAGAGGRGLFMRTVNATWGLGMNHTRLAARDNRIRGADTYAIDVYLETTGNAQIKDLEIVGNRAWDDMPTPTCITGVRIQNPEMVENSISFYGNTQDASMTPVVGLDSGSWFTGGTYPKTFAGYENPNGNLYAPPASTYARMDSATIYRKESAESANTGWVEMKAALRTAIRGMSTRKNGSSTLTWSGAEMPPSVPGDIELLIVSHVDNSSMSTPSLTTPSRFRLKSNNNANAAGVFHRGAIYWRRVRAGDVPPVVAAVGASNTAILIAIKDPTNTFDPFSSVVTVSGHSFSFDEDVDITGLTTTANDQLVLDIITWIDGGGSGSGDVTSWTNTDLEESVEVYDVVEDANSTYQGIAIHSGRVSDSGTVVNTTEADLITPSYSIWSGFKLAIIPASELGRSTGSITCVAKASLSDGEYLTIPDGMRPAVVYEFDVAGDGVTGGRVQVNVSSDTTAAQVAARLRTAILANQPSLNVIDNADGTLDVVHQWPGLGGNATITENVSNAGFTVSGMSGGAG